MRHVRRWILCGSLAVLVLLPGRAEYVNFEVSHVHPIDLTPVVPPAEPRLLAVNTPDAVLEVFAVQADGSLLHDKSIRVGLEPVTVVARSAGEAWVVNQLSDTVDVVDLDAGLVVKSLAVGDEPTDVTFAGGKAFVAVAGEDAVKVYDLGHLDGVPAVVPVFSRKPRALAVSPSGGSVYAVTLFSGNGTTVVNAGELWAMGAGLVGSRLAALGLNEMTCAGPKPTYPSLPPGIQRDEALTDPQVDPADPDNPENFPKVGLIVRWDEASGQWRDESGADWSGCLPIRLPDDDLFVIDVETLAVTSVPHLGTTLFEVSVNPGDGRIYVPNTDARNFVRFEHPLGVRGHVVDDRLSIVDPADAFSSATIDLNTHIVRTSDPATNLAERLASVSQPGMLVWDQDGSTGYMTAIGSRKVFRVSGGCSSGGCIFGPDRADPQAVEIGEGPTGVALLESKQRLYVLNRFANSVAIADSIALTKLDEIPMHDPSPVADRIGRRFLYDAIVGSGHGDAACSSCHVSGDRDNLAWDLGNPEGEFAPYTGAGDNVRFIVPVGGDPLTCPDPLQCAAHEGFDPQKGPMTTQTLRTMLEPLHWRGDRATMNDFNRAFPDLMGTPDIGPVNGKPAGLSAQAMEQFRQFALRIAFPPNPHRNVDDTLPDAVQPVPGHPFAGNPAEGRRVFDEDPVDANQPCKACHTHPFGAAGGTAGGVTPETPTSADAAALFNGTADQSFHSDMKVPHLRNMYEKVGPLFGDHVAPPPDRTAGFGYTHDGSVPDLGTFLSNSVFTMSAQQVRDVVAFLFYFPTGTRPAVGRQVTLPPGTPPTGTPAEESRLTDLIGDSAKPTLGDLSDPERHCELVAATRMDGRLRRFHLSGGTWTTDLAGEGPRTTTELREGAEGPIDFLCATIGSGVRLGGDRDEDASLDGDDCAPADPATWAPSGEVGGLTVGSGAATMLGWEDQSPATGPGLRYEVLGGLLSELRGTGLAAATGCLVGDLADPSWADGNPDPGPGEGRYYLVRGRNACGVGGAGPGRGALNGLQCTGP